MYIGLGLRDWTKKEIYDPIQNVRKFSKSLVNYKKTIAAHNTSTKPTVKKRGVNLRQLA